MRAGDLMPTYESGPQGSGTARFARWMLTCAVRYWPEGSRHWGAALAAEIDETTNGFDAMRWSLGGIMFFARSVLSSAWAWLKLPAGSSLPGAAGGPSLRPKRSRIFTAAVLAATALLLALPEGREAVRTVTASWLEFMPTNSDQPTLDKLAARAEKEKDAETLAFVALSWTRNSTPDAEQRAEKLVEQTVGLDPSFIWIYGAKNHGANLYPAQKEWVNRLQTSDPDNAVPILIEANALAEQKLNLRYNDKDDEKLADDPQWMALMGRAFAAPKYDSYFGKHIRLMQAVWNRNPNLPPEIPLMGVWSHAIPNLYAMRLYGKIQLNAAHKALVAGETKQAEVLTQGVATFGARMTNSSVTMIEELIGVAISRMADKEFAEIYAAEGKPEEARRATAHMDELEQASRHRFGRDDAGRAERARTFDRQAVLVQGSAILGGLALVCGIVGIFALEIWRGKPAAQAGLWRQVLCFAADWAPVTLLVASGAFLAGFLPFQKVLADFRVSSFQPTDEMRVGEAMFSLATVPERVLGVDAAVTFWSAVTYLLSAIVVGMVALGVYRSRRVQTKPA